MIDSKARQQVASFTMGPGDGVGLGSGRPLGSKDEVASGVSAGPPGAWSAPKVHLPVLPEHYEPPEEPAPGEKPKRRYWPS